MHSPRLFCLISTTALLASCKVGPNYTQPEVGTPSIFRFGSSKGTRSLGDLDWRSVFKDAALRSLIEETLANNLDLRVAATRVLQAQAGVVSARSQFFPTIGAGYDFTHTQVSKNLQLGNVNIPSVFDNEQHSVGISLLQYEADFWGKIRRSNEASRAKLVATQEGQRQVQSGLIAGVATAFVTLREQDLELSIASRTLVARTQSLKLITTRQKGGQSSLTDVKQAEVLVAETEAAMRVIEKQIAQLENQLSYLAGRAPGSIRRSGGLASGIVVPAPAGLPSDLLNRRPDIRVAEQSLIAATAQIGVAKAQLLPSFTLTAGAGLRSKEFGDFFNNPTRLWQIGPGVSVPVFTAGRLMAGLRISQAAREGAEAEYRKIVLQALREVSDALISRQKSAGLTTAQRSVVTARQEALNLIRQSYENGATSYLEVLYNDQQLFGAELSLARAQLQEVTASIELYRSLGGGWDRTSLPLPLAANQLH